MGPYRNQVPLHVLQLHGADVILGADWLQAVGEEISYTGGTVTVHCPNGGQAILVAGGDRTEEILLSPLQLKRLMENDPMAQLFVVNLK
jgi:hypothetical protein